METRNGSEDNASINVYDFGFESNDCMDFERPTAIDEGRFPGHAYLITPDLGVRPIDPFIQNKYSQLLNSALNFSSYH